MLAVTLLGGTNFTVDGAVVRTELGQAGRLLACYLFEFSGRAQRRERLADMFWSELDSDKARAALNTAIWRIRKLLDLGRAGGGRALVTIGDDLVLGPMPGVHVDTHGLQRLGRETLARGEPLTRADEVEVTLAVDSYAGPFLDGEDNDWVLQERERLHCLFVRSSVALMQAAAARQDYERALEYGRRVLAVDSLRESVQRDVMLLLVLNGQRAEAIHAFQRLKFMLKADLGIEPMPETAQLREDIYSGAVFSRLGEQVAAQFSPAPSLRRTAKNPAQGIGEEIGR